jgi:hypothetical protein
MTDLESQALLQSIVNQGGGYSDPLPRETSPYIKPDQMNPALIGYAAQNFQGGQQNQFSPLGLMGGGAGFGKSIFMSRAGTVKKAKKK